MPKMRTIKFTDEQLRNLATFLSRVPINKEGNEGITHLEAAAYVDLFQTINKEVLEKMDNPVNKKDGSK